MKEFAKRFIDKECLISSFDSNHQFEGVIKEVSDSAILVEKNGTVEAMNICTLGLLATMTRKPMQSSKAWKRVLLNCLHRKSATYMVLNTGHLTLHM